MATWRTLLLSRVNYFNEDPDTLLCWLSKEELDREFDESRLQPSSVLALAWTTNLVYLLFVYDGFRTVWALPRNPTIGSTTDPSFPKRADK